MVTLEYSMTLKVTQYQSILDSQLSLCMPKWSTLSAPPDSGKVVLVEAKAHVGELVSAGTKASRGSRERIIARRGM